jgi:hypothetical protein
MIQGPDLICRSIGSRWDIPHKVRSMCIAPATLDPAKIWKQLGSNFFVASPPTVPPIGTLGHLLTRQARWFNIALEGIIPGLSASKSRDHFIQNLPERAQSRGQSVSCDEC